MLGTMGERLTNEIKLRVFRGESRKTDVGGKRGIREPILPAGWRGESSGEGKKKKKRVFPLQRDVRDIVLRTEPDFHSGPTVRRMFRDEVGNAVYFPNIRSESHWKKARCLQEGCGTQVTLWGLQYGQKGVTAPWWL